MPGYIYKRVTLVIQPVADVDLPVGVVHGASITFLIVTHLADVDVTVFVNDRSYVFISFLASFDLAKIGRLILIKNKAKRTRWRFSFVI